MEGFEASLVCEQQNGGVGGAQHLRTWVVSETCVRARGSREPGMILAVCWRDRTGTLTRSTAGARHFGGVSGVIMVFAAELLPRDSCNLSSVEEISDSESLSLSDDARRLITERRADRSAHVLSSAPQKFLMCFKAFCPS